MLAGLVFLFALPGRTGAAEPELSLARIEEEFATCVRYLREGKLRTEQVTEEKDLVSKLEQLNAFVADLVGKNVPATRGVAATGVFEHVGSLEAAYNRELTRLRRAITGTPNLDPLLREALEDGQRRLEARRARFIAQRDEVANLRQELSEFVDLTRIISEEYKATREFGEADARNYVAKALREWAAGGRKAKEGQGSVRPAPPVQEAPAPSGFPSPVTLRPALPQVPQALPEPSVPSAPPAPEPSRPQSLVTLRPAPAREPSPVPANPVLERYRRAAESGSSDAQNNLGAMLERGEGVAADPAEAAKWYRKAAEQGNGTSQFNLGLLYQQGKGVPKSSVEAIRWFRRAADTGHVDAQNMLALAYLRGEGVNRDYAEAAKWFRRPAEQGNSGAQFYLGMMHLRGDGVVKDSATGAQWYRKAAEQGNPSAQNNLGDLYLRGEGVRQDHAEAVKWFQKAADRGNATAQNNLSQAYEAGRGVRKDLVQAHAWGNLAQAGGNAAAKSRLPKLEERLTRSQLEEAMRVARDLSAKVDSRN